MPAELTASTARFPSCWPWSISPGSTPVSRRAGPVGGDARLADHAPVGQVLELRAEDRGRPAAAGPGEQLLQGVGRRLAVVVQQPDPLGTARRVPPAGRAAGRCRARATAAPYPVSGSMPKTASWPSSSVSVAPLRSWLPVSTPITRCTGWVCSRTALTSPGSSRAASWATTTAVTT